MNVVTNFANVLILWSQHRELPHDHSKIDGCQHRTKGKITKKPLHSLLISFIYLLGRRNNYRTLDLNNFMTNTTLKPIGKSINLTPFWFCEFYKLIIYIYNKNVEQAGIEKPIVQRSTFVGKFFGINRDVLYRYFTYISILYK